MRIGVIGCGHMGSWFIRGLATEHKVAVFDSDPKKMDPLANVERLAVPADFGSFRPEFLLNAVNLQNTLAAFHEVSGHLPADCIISDITSVKGQIPEYYKESGFRFASCHPMFGPNFADLYHLREENAIIISESASEAREFLRVFFKRFDLHVFECSFAEHDELMAYSLTLPFASSIVFSACVSTHAVPGTTFSRHKKIAEKLLQEDDYLLSEVMFNPYSLKQLEKISSRLELLKHIIKARDYEEATKFFARLRENLGGPKVETTSR